MPFHAGVYMCMFRHGSMCVACLQGARYCSVPCMAGCAVLLECLMAVQAGSCQHTACVRLAVTQPRRRWVTVVWIVPLGHLHRGLLISRMAVTCVTQHLHGCLHSHGLYPVALACVAVCMLTALSKVTHVGLGCLYRPLDCWQVHGTVGLAHGWAMCGSQVLAVAVLVCHCGCKVASCRSCASHIHGVDIMLGTPALNLTMVITELHLVLGVHSAYSLEVCLGGLLGKILYDNVVPCEVDSWLDS